MGMLQDWQTTKKEYQKIVGEKTPAKTILFFRIGNGIEAALKKCDEMAEKSKKDTTGKAVTELQKFASELLKASSKLGDELKSEIGKETTKETKEGKAAALEMLKKRLKKYDAYYASLLANAQALKSVQGLNPMEALTEMTTKTVGPIMRKGLADMAALVTKLKANPTREIYNKNIIDTRNMTTALGKIVVARKKLTTLPDPQTFIAALSPYADGKGSADKTSAPSDWGKNEILQEANQLAVLTKTIKTTYQDML